MTGSTDQLRDGGTIVAEGLAREGVPFLFTLCGGHISPILVGAKRRGVRVVDVRDEATAVFAADAVARLGGRPGVAAVTAGPGLTNSITALKNAQMAQSPLVLLGGATATLLRGRGALQDIDQEALIGPHVKWLGRAARVRDLAPLLRRAFHEAASGAPGPVFLELPVDVLYAEPVVRSLYGLGELKAGASVVERLLRRRLGRHVERLFAPGGRTRAPERPAAQLPDAAPRLLAEAARLVREASRPLVVLGSEAVTSPGAATRTREALERLGVPVYLSGMARGLLGAEHPLVLRHRRKEALRRADLVILAGVPCDFRLGYGRHLARGAPCISIQRDRAALRKNLWPRVAVHGDASRTLEALASRGSGGEGEGGSPGAPRREWIDELRARDAERDAEIGRMALEPAPPRNPVALCQALERALDPESIIVVDGGDFAATASYIVRPRGPLSWLDPGPFGTLGVGAGFALGAKLSRPQAEVWLLWGDGSSAYGLQELDTFVRHGIGVIAVVANDAAWMQIARDQATILGDDVGTALRRTDYHRVAEGWGGRGLLLGPDDDADQVLAQARRIARGGEPVVVNAHLGRTEFRKGSISL